MPGTAPRGRLETRPQTPLKRTHHVSRSPRHPLRQGTLPADGRSRRAHHPAAGPALRAHRRTGQPVDVGPRRTAGRPDRLRGPGRGQPKASFTESEVTRGQVAEWAARDGVAHAEPLGISQSRFQALGPAARRPGRPAWRSSAPRPGAPAWRPAPWPRERSLIGAGLAEELELQRRQPRHGGRHRTDGLRPSSRTSGTPTPASSGPRSADWRKLAHITDADAAATVMAVTSDGGHTGRTATPPTPPPGRVSTTRRRVLPGPGLLQERERLAAADAGVPLRHLGPGDRGLPDGLDGPAHP